MRNFFFSVGLLLSAAAAEAAVLPVRILPFAALSVGVAAAAAAPLALKALSLPSAPLSLPSLPAPVSGPMSLPGPASPLPLPQAVELAPDDIHLDWSFLDGPDAAVVVLPRGRGPKPLPPAGAAAQLTFAAKGAARLFDHARPLVLIEAE
jgi:hypothetical protein